MKTTIAKKPVKKAAKKTTKSVKKVVKKTLKPAKKVAKRVYEYHQVNHLLRIFDDFNFHYENYGVITQEMADKTREEYNGVLDDLVGYEVEIHSEGDHRHDGQFVDYYFTFTSPKGKVTELTTEMCLMVGWNYHHTLKIK